MPSITAVRILSEFSMAGFIGNVACWIQKRKNSNAALITNTKIKNNFVYYYIFFYLSLSVSCSLRLICAPFFLEGCILWPKTVSKFPGVVLCLRCMSRGPAGWWDRRRQRSTLLGILLWEIGWFVRWLLTQLREPSMGCLLALCTLTAAGSLIFVLSEINTGAGILLSHWVVGLSHLRAENENKLLTFTQNTKKKKVKL